MTTSWTEIRKDFPITKKYLYFDHAAGGPIPRPVREAGEQYYREQSEEADFAWMKWLDRLRQVRTRVARFLNADPSEITFVQSTSHGMNLIAELLAGQGSVLTNTCEFPSSTVPWVYRKANLIWQEPQKNRVELKTLEERLSPEIKTILASFVQYATGFRQNLGALGEIKKDRFLVVNASQGLGVFPVDVQAMKIDFLVAASYKWMLAGYGGGILYIKKKWLEAFKPSSIGWRSVLDPEAMDNRSTQFKSEATRYELGCPSFPTIFTLGASVDYLMQIGMEKISERVLELTQFLITGLEKMGLEVTSPKENTERSGIVIFRHADSKKLWKQLMQEGVCVSPRGEGIRVAPHFYNTHEELEKFLTILNKLI